MLCFSFYFSIADGFMLPLKLKLIQKLSILNIHLEASSRAYSEFCQTSKMKVFTSYSFWFLTISAKSSFLDVWQESLFASVARNNLRIKFNLRCCQGFEFVFVIIYTTSIEGLRMKSVGYLLLSSTKHKVILCKVKSRDLMFTIFAE